MHTAGGLVVGDQLTLRAHWPCSTKRERPTVPYTFWAATLVIRVEAGSDLEWLPQELVLFAGGLLAGHGRRTAGPQRRRRNPGPSATFCCSRASVSIHTGDDPAGWT